VDGEGGNQVGKFFAGFVAEVAVKIFGVALEPLLAKAQGGGVLIVKSGPVVDGVLKLLTYGVAKIVPASVEKEFR